MFRLCRRLRVPFAGLLLVLLAAPVAAACCLEIAEPMPCCAQGEQDARLALPCCAVDAEQARQSQPAASPVIRTDANPLLVSIVALAGPIVPVHATQHDSDSINGPPGNRLYIRLSIIRR